MDQSTLDCIILALTYCVFHVIACIQSRKFFKKGITK